MANFDTGYSKLGNYIKDSAAKPVLNEGCSLPCELLTLDHSFSYDCKSLYNLTVIEGNILIYVTGSFLHVYYTESGQLLCHKSYGSGGISRVTANHLSPHLAIAERGENPSIFVCHWPSFDIIHILENGAAKGYSYLEYSPKADMLLSQSSAPDFIITIWLWEKSEILFRCKAYERDVYCVHFSAFFDHQLVSAGACHIKFWNMNDTFTGPKLQGELGRFGKTEICDLLSALPLPDGTFASGSSWGNILIWDEGVIKFEVFRTGRLHCHSGQITQLVFCNSALLTAGFDGAVRLWNYETIEMADPFDDETVIEMEPLFELLVTKDFVSVQLLSLVKAQNTPSDTTWFAQDASGAVWKLDISTNVDAKAPKILFVCHSGSVIAVGASPTEDVFASLGTDGKLFVYDYMEKKILNHKEFAYSGKCLLWLPQTVAPSGKQMIGGFSDGVVRVLAITSSGCQVAQALKPHTEAVTCLAFMESPSEHLLATGSDDGTVFLFRVESSTLQLVSLGVFSVDSPVMCLLWSSTASRYLIIGCMDGRILHCSIPSPMLRASEDTNFILLSPTVLSVEMVLQDLRAFENSKREIKVTDDQQRSEELVEEPEEEDHCELISGPILFLWSSPFNTVWFSIGDVKPGTIFEYNIHENRLIRTFDIMAASTSQVYCCCYSQKNDCLFLGFSNGCIGGVRPLNPESDLWFSQLHKSNNDTIRQLCFNWDESCLFSCGDEGTLFSFKLPDSLSTRNLRPESVPLKFVLISSDIDGKASKSIEEVQIRKNYEERVRVGEEHKKRVKGEISMLGKLYLNILATNANLPEPLRLSNDELIPDARVDNDVKEALADEDEEETKVLLRETERSKLWLTKLQNYFVDDLETLLIRIECIESHESVTTYRLPKLESNFERNLLSVKQNMLDLEAKGRKCTVIAQTAVPTEKLLEGLNPIDALLKQVSSLGDVQRHFQLYRLYEKYTKRRVAEKARAQMWQEFLDRKPDPDRTEPAELMALEGAKENLGDHTLKTSPDYKVPKHKNVSTVSKQLSLLEAKQAFYTLKYSFNCKVLSLRHRKWELKRKHVQLREVYSGISPILNAPNLPHISEDAEYPEKQFQYSGESNVIENLPINIKPSRSQGEVATQLKFASDLYSMELSELQGLQVTNLSDQAEFDLRQKNLRQQIIDQMWKDVANFDCDVRTLRDEKIKLDAQLKFFEAYILTLSRELHLLKDFEEEEQMKSDVALSFLKEKEELQRAINETFLMIDLKMKEIHSNEDEIKLLVANYLCTIADNKFFAFLKKIFKKKHKFPKAENSDSDDSSSSDDDSESDDDEDTKSFDSKDFNVYDMNENICPVGCDRALYDLAFATRAQRHKLENILADRKRDLESKRKLLDSSNKQMLVTDKRYLTALKDLENFQREKQVKLNEIGTLVILRLKQFQNFKDDENLEMIDDSVLMSAPLLSQLRERGVQLEKETKQQIERRNQSKQHLQRMAIDNRYMIQLINSKEEDIKETMIKKFGSIVDLNELEEALIKKLLTDVGFISFELQKTLTSQLGPLNERLNRRKETYASRLQQNTERLNIIALLTEEKSKVEKLLDKQEINIAVISVDKYAEIERLDEVVKKQTKKIAWLQDEIHAIKYKHTRADHQSRLDFPISSLKYADGEVYKVPEMLKLELRSLVEDIEELLADVEGGFATTEGAVRLGNVITEFAEKLPVSSLKSMLKKLEEEQLVDCVDEAGGCTFDAIISKAKLALEMAPEFDSPDDTLKDMDDSCDEN